MLSPELATDVMSILEAKIRMCRRCPLSKLRTNAVPGEGPVPCQIVFVGEAPGAEEDAQGRPFVGRAGKYMDEVLGRLGLSRKDIFITNVLKCRPPENRTPQISEMRACLPYLKAQLKVLSPVVVCALGRVSLQALVGPRYRISVVHGRPLRDTRTGIFIFPMYHPAAALHKPELKAVVEADFRAFAGFLATLRKEGVLRQ